MMAAIGTYAVLIFGLVMLLVAITMYAILIHKQWRARRWPTVPGTILSVKVKSRWIADNSTSNSSGRYYQAHVSFTYVVGDQRFQGNRHGRSGVWLGSAKSALKIAARVKKGDTVAVHYDPRNPRHAMIWPHIGWLDIIVVLIPFLLFLVPLAATMH